MHAALPELADDFDIDVELCTRRRWLVTGCAGFIGSHLTEALLRAGQDVVGLDDFSTGHVDNLDAVRQAVGADAWARFNLIEASIVDPDACRGACVGVDRVLHQAALGSVPRSLRDPLRTHAVNCTGFLNMLVAARDAGCGRVVFASSSATYGDHPDLPKREDRIGHPLSPYAVTKVTNELYARVFAHGDAMQILGLRYFNVFGPRQDPEGPYAAVIPNWATRIAKGEVCDINGDGETSRDFCFVANVVQANLRAALVPATGPLYAVFNIAFGARTTLNALHAMMARLLAERIPGLNPPPPRHRPFRAGDVRHSLADIGRARHQLGYIPTHDLSRGLREAMPWYVANCNLESTPGVQP